MKGHGSAWEKPPQTRARLQVTDGCRRRAQLEPLGSVTQCGACRDDDYLHAEYFQLYQRAMESYRNLFSQQI